MLKSNSSKKGRAAKPSLAGCIPASSYFGVSSNASYWLRDSGRNTNHNRLALVLDNMT